MTNKKAILGLSIAAVLAVGLMGTPAFANFLGFDEITPLKKTKVKFDDDEYDKIKFKLTQKVQTDGSAFGGYAIFTSGHVVAVTSHPGFYDSLGQSEPTLDLAVPFPGGAGLCDGADTGCGAEWHTHLVEPVQNDLCGLAAVGALTLQEPSEELKIKAKKIVLREIESDDDDFTDALSGADDKEWVVGSPVDLEDALLAFAGIVVPQDGTFTGVAFDLHPAFVGGELQAVCIGDTTALADVLPGHP